MFRNLFITLMLAGLFVSCNTDTTRPEFADDTDLIEAIQMATNKQDVLVSDLPSQSKKVLEQDYTENYVDDAKFAPKLGYEVGLRKEMGFLLGDRYQAYFDLNGRELKGFYGSKKDRGWGNKGGKWRKGNRGGTDGFRLVYPVTFIMPDGSTITGDDEKEVCTAIKEWFKANPGSKERPTLEYPVDVVFEDGTTKTINNAEEMKRLITSFRGKDRGKEPCFKYVYPITYIMPDGSTITISGEDDMENKRALRLWYKENTGYTDKPVLQYPVVVILKDGTEMTINNEEEMRGLKARCADHNRGRDRVPCFKLKHPITYILPDGSTITVLSEDDLENKMAIRLWYKENSSYTEKPALQYPVVAILKDGTELTINNEDEMRRLKDSCDEDRGGGEGRG